MGKSKGKRKELSKGITIATSQPCTINPDECDSHDALCIYYHEEEKVYSAYCFACGASTQNYQYGGEQSNHKRYNQHSNSNQNNQESYNMNDLPEFEDIRDEYCSMTNTDRRIRDDIYEFIGVKHELNGDGVKLDAVYYPIHKNGELTGYTVRERFPDDFEDSSKAGTLKYFKRKVGDISGACQLVGQDLWEAGSKKRLLLVEGVEDMATAISMLCRKLKCEPIAIPFAVVSVPHGSNVRAIKDNITYMSSFDEILLNIDSDQAGRDFEDKLTKLLPIGKVKLVRLPDMYKDASDMWRKLRTANEFDTQANNYWGYLFKAQKYSPAGIFGLSEGWADYLTRGTEEKIPFPDSFGTLNEKTHGGYTLAEIVNIIAASSVGKSSFIKEMIYTALKTTNYNIGVCSFEENIGEFIEGMLSVHMSTQLNEISLDERDRAKEEMAFKELVYYKPDGEEEFTMETPTGELEDLPEGTPENGVNYGSVEVEEVRERIHYLDHQGALEGNDLLDNLNFLIKGCDCKIIIIDPVTLALANSGMDEDEYTSDVLKMVKREKVALINCHHVRKNGGGAKANSEGADLSEEDVRGSGSHFQTGMVNVILMRNKVHENPIIRNTTRLKLSKCRRHGKNTGLAGFTYYNGDTGRLELGHSPEEIEEGVLDMDEVMMD